MSKQKSNKTSDTAAAGSPLYVEPAGKFHLGGLANVAAFGLAMAAIYCAGYRPAAAPPLRPHGLAHAHRYWHVATGRC